MIMAENNKNNTEMEENRLKGQIKVEKKSFTRKIIDFLFSDKIDSIGNYLTYEVVRPTIIDLIYKSIVGAAGMALYNSAAQRNQNPLQQRYSGAQRNYTPYDQMAYQAPPGQFYANVQAAPGYYGQGLGLNDISFNTKDDALYQIGRLKDMITRYGKVRVSDYYLDVGYTPPPSDWAVQGAGWYSIEGAKPVPTTNGRWIINFPPPVSIK